MNWLDVVVILPLLIGLIHGLIKGLISEVMSVAAIVLGGLGAYEWGQIAANWLYSQWEWQPPICKAIAYALIFIAIAIVLTIAANLLSKFFKAIHLGGLNRLLGGVFGMLKWGVIVLVVVMCTDLLNAQLQFLPQDTVASSLLYRNAVQLANAIWHTVGA